MTETVLEAKRYFNEREVAAFTGLSVRSLQQHRWKGIGIPYIKLGGGRSSRVYYSYTDVIGYLESHKVQTRDP